LKKTLLFACLMYMILLEACGNPLQKPKAAFAPNYIAAHRGYSVAAPENTMPAFEAAYRAGADAIEFDMQVTRDSHIVIIHDKTVSRTTNGKGKITDLTLSQIEKLDAGSRFSQRFRGTKIPTLFEVLDFVKGHSPLSMFSEIKHYRTSADIRLMIEPILQRGL
jgi:glycerophosphoryl diester phosphodiesterase